MAALACLALATPAVWTGTARGGSVPPGAAEGTERVLVTLRAGFVPEARLSAAGVAAQRDGIDRRRAEVEAALAGTGARVARRYETVPVLAVDATPAALRALRAAPAVAGVVADVAVPPVLDDSVPLVRADDTAAAGFDGSGTVVAILDTGVDATHPFLAGRVVEEACYSITNSCPNAQPSQTGTGSGAPCTFASACEHGTHVAGIAAGRDDGSIGFDGVAPGASIMAVQIFSQFSGSICAGAGENPCALTWLSDQIAGLERVYALRDTYEIAAVNMSIGGFNSTTYCDSWPLKPAIDNLRAAGIATVIAAGNDASTTGLSYPACISSAVSVGSTTKADAVSSFSNSAPFLSLWAPGSSIQSSVPGGSFESWNGTSMATPHVTGAFAVARQVAPAAGVTDLLARFTSAGPAVTDARNGVTKRRLDVWDALTPGAPTGVAAVAGDGRATVSWTAPADPAGAPLTGFDVVASPGGATAAAGPSASSAVVTGLTAGTAYTFTVTARNALGPGDPSTPSSAAVPGTTVAAGLAAVTEGDAGTALVEIPVALTAASSLPVTVHWQTLGWLATSGADFTPASGDVVFDPGETAATIAVSVLGDALDEDDEYLLVWLNPATNATVGGFYGLGFGRIVDDDPPPVLVPGVAAVAEGDAGTTLVEVPIALDAPSGRTVTATYETLDWTAQAPGDYTATAGTVTFDPGETVATVPVVVRGDGLAEADEFFLVRVTGAVHATVGGFFGLGAGVVANDD